MSDAVGSGTAAPVAGAGGPVLERDVTIRNQKGLHARAAAKFVKLAAVYEAEVLVAKNETEVSGRSILGLMMLAAAPGCCIRMRVSGPDAEAALAALVDLVDRKFDEE